MSKYSYSDARYITSVTGVLFLTQLILLVFYPDGIRPELEWIPILCGIAFFISVIYSATLIILNAKNKDKDV